MSQKSGETIKRSAKGPPRWYRRHFLPPMATPTRTGGCGGTTKSWCAARPTPEEPQIWCLVLEVFVEPSENLLPHMEHIRSPRDFMALARVLNQARPPIQPK